MSIFDGINVALEAKEFTIKAYQSDMDAFNEIKMTLNANLSEGEIREEDIFSKLIQFAKGSANSTAAKKIKAPGKSSVKSETNSQIEVQ